MIWSSNLDIFPLKNISSFKLRIFNIVAVCLYLVHYSLRNFRNAIPIRKSVGVISQPSRSGIGADYGLEFIHCVGGRQPQIHKLWTLAENLPQSPENARATVRHVRDVCLRENRMSRAENLLRAHHTGCDKRGYWSDDDLDGWVDQ